MEEILDLFAGIDHPSLPAFEKLTAHLPVEEQARYRNLIFKATLNRYNHLSERMRAFFRVFVRKNRQQYLDYVVAETLLGELRYPATELDMLYKTVYLLEKAGSGLNAQKRPKAKKRRMEATTAGLAFSLSLAFQSPYALSTLHQKMRTDLLDEGDLKDLRLLPGHPMIKKP
jgi:hypothetical protein